MSKRIIGITIILIILLATTSLATLNAELDVSSNVTNAKPGEEITVILKLKNIQDSVSGIQGLSADIQYDTNVFEEITNSSVTSELFSQYSEGSLILGNIEDTGVLTDTNIAQIKFKVKANIEEQVTKINFNTVRICDKENEQITIDNQSLSISIKQNSIQQQTQLNKIAITINPKKTAYTEGEKFDTTGMEITATYSDNSTKKVTGYTYSPSGALKTSDSTITISYQESGITKTAVLPIAVKTKSQTTPQNNTNNETPNGNTSENDIVYAGIEDYIMVVPMGITIAIIAYIQYKKYSKYSK